jgi:hypothetical protein
VDPDTYSNYAYADTVVYYDPQPPPPESTPTPAPTAPSPAASPQKRKKCKKHRASASKKKKKKKKCKKGKRRQAGVHRMSGARFRAAHPRWAGPSHNPFRLDGR